MRGQARAHSCVAACTLIRTLAGRNHWDLPDSAGAFVLSRSQPDPSCDSGMRYQLNGGTPDGFAYADLAIAAQSTARAARFEVATGVGLAPVSPTIHEFVLSAVRLWFFVA